MTVTIPIARLISIIFFSVVCLSCGEDNKSGTVQQEPGSMPVEKMSTDSNSSMPVQTPGDSTARIPNPYDSSKR